ncbi:solute carrier family 22 member 15 isoform X2 [Folsomia candida]|nr:solute carrier family 22 member 15 isoform X2 [Folsomia candida]
MDLDDVYVQIGEFGVQQKIYFLSLGLFNLYAPLHLVQTVFTGQQPHFTCILSNGSAVNNTCPENLLSNCDHVQFTHLPDSYARQWSLICDEAYKSKLVQSFFMAGVGIGAVILGAVADRIGRRKTLVGTLMGMIIFGIASSFVPWYWGYIVLRFCVGFFAAGNILSSFVLSSELIGPSKRGIAGNIFQVFFAFGIVILSLLAYAFTNWRILSAAATSIGILYFFLFIMLPESPRWLINHQRIREAKHILRTMADRNGMIFPSDLEINLPPPNAHRGHLCDLFRRRKTTVSTLVQLYSWFVNSVVYYGLTLASDKLGSNIYVSTMLSGIVELPAYFITALLIDWLGRRLPLSIFMVIGGISCILIEVINHPEVIFILALVGKLCIAASFAIIYIHSAELFPTVIRNSGLGLCSLFARVGGIVAPFISLADSVETSLQFTIFGILSLSSGLLNLLLEETLNRTLPETLDDLKGESNLRNVRGRYARLASDELEQSEEETNDSSEIYKSSHMLAT